MHSPPPLQGLDGVFGGVGFRALAPAPEHIDFRAQLDGEVNCVHGLLEGVGAHFGVVAGERAVFEGGVGKQVGRAHHQAHVVVI
jgi:hypothetical protein